LDVCIRGLRGTERGTKDLTDGGRKVARRGRAGGSAEARAAAPKTAVRQSRVRAASPLRADPTDLEAVLASSPAILLAVETPFGRASAHVTAAAEPRGALVLGHGAGGGVAARDLVAASAAAQSAGFSVALVEQPYRVAGRRSPAPAHQLDAAWVAVVEHLAGAELRGLPVVAGGRSSGARVACRTASTVGAVGVLCLAFPLVPPAHAGKEPAPSRLPELDAVTVPVLVVQGTTDRFGMPPPAARRSVVRIRGDHSLRSDLGALGAAVGDWLAALL
jgi:uncharacterized protein